LQPISYDVFKLFMRAYLEMDLPQPLSTHLFLAFSQKPKQETPDLPKEGASSYEPNSPGMWTRFPQDGGKDNPLP
jgi:diacylglycerol kinase (ATP)